MDAETRKKVEAAFEEKSSDLSKVSDQGVIDKVNAAFEGKTAEPKGKELSAEERLLDNTSGLTLKVGSFDTGIELPPEAIQALVGAGKRLTEIGTLGAHKTDEKAAEELATSGYATAGEVVADLAAMAAGGSALRGAGMISKAPTLAQTVLGNAAYAGATNEDRLDSALAAAAGGAAGHGAAKLLGKAINPKVTKGARDVIEDGGVVTPGAIVGGRAKILEDKLTSTPFMGDVVAGAQRKSIEQWNKGAINSVLKPIGKSLSKKTAAGQDAIDEAAKKVSKEYDKVLSKMDVRFDSEFAKNVTSLNGLVKSLSPKQAKKFDDILTNDVLRPFDNPNRVLLGKTFKEVDSVVRKKYQKLYKNDPKLADAVRTLHLELLDMAKRQHPQLGKRLDAADVAYAKLKRVEGAAQRLGREDGIFGPSDLLREVQKTTSKSNFAAGKGFDQRAIQEAKKVLPNKYPDSGTAGRLAQLLAVGGSVAEPGLAVPLVGGAALYTSPGVKLMQKLLTGGRGKTTKAIREYTEASAPFVGMLGGALGMQAE